jgi:hypothetical protein
MVEALADDIVEFLKKFGLAGHWKSPASCISKWRIPTSSQGEAKKHAAQRGKDNPALRTGAGECRTLRENMSEKWINVPVLGQTPFILTVRQGLPHDLCVLG